MRVGIRAERQQGLRADRQVVRRHPVHRGVPVGVERCDVGARANEERGGVLVGPRHAARVQRGGASGRDVVDQVGVRVKELRERGVRLGDAGVGLGVEPGDGLGDRCVASAVVNRAGPWVVALVLLPDDHATVRGALDRAAVDARAHAVGVRVEPLVVRPTRGAVLFLHAGRVWIVRYLHAVLPVVRRHGGAARCRGRSGGGCRGVDGGREEQQGPWAESHAACI